VRPDFTSAIAMENFETVFHAASRADADAASRQTKQLFSTAKREGGERTL
jgi:hypothetical protein